MLERVGTPNLHVSSSYYEVDLIRVPLHLCHFYNQLVTMDIACKNLLAREKLLGEEWGDDVIYLNDHHRLFEPVLESKTKLCEME